MRRLFELTSCGVATPTLCLFSFLIHLGINGKWTLIFSFKQAQKANSLLLCCLISYSPN